MERRISHWRLRTRTLELGVRTLVMGVVNITPDSFSDGGSYLAPDAALARCLQCLDEGADILDLGAESTRPGSHAGGADAAVSAEEEQSRLLPVLEGILKARPDAVISVDTYRAATARAALQAGAEIVNDVSGLTWDAGMASVCAEFGAGLVLMHTRGRPDEWEKQSRLNGDELLPLVRSGLAESMAVAERAGLAAEALVLDPGYGFGKRYEENFALLARQGELLGLGRPLLAGLSRKSFLGRALQGMYEGDVPMVARDRASLIAMTTAIFHGASIVRVHAVRAAAEAVVLVDAMLGMSRLAE